MSKKEAIFICGMIAIVMTWAVVSARQRAEHSTCRPDDTTCLAPGETMTIVPNLSAEIARKNDTGGVVWGGDPGKAIQFKACAKGFAPNPPIPPGELRIYANLLVFNEGNGKLSCAKVGDRKKAQ